MAESNELRDVENEYNRIHHQFLVALLAAVTLLVVGAAVYHRLLHLTWVNAFYFCTVTLTTVGYGDITPNTNTSKIFTIFYLLIGVGIIATFANLIIKNSAVRRELRLARRSNKRSNN